MAVPRANLFASLFSNFRFFLQPVYFEKKLFAAVSFFSYMACAPYYKQFFQYIIPFVESHYNVSTKRGDRIFAGLSMGSIQALNIALFSPERFGYVLPLSTGYFPQQLKTLEEKYSSALKNPDINKLKLFWIAMGGENDIAYQYGKIVNAVLDKYGIKYKTADYPAGDTFITWRHNLYGFAPLLFR